MQKKTIYVALMFGCLLQAKTLTLQDSIDKTLTNHPDIKSFALKVKQSKSSYKSAYSAYLPQVNLQANYNFTQTFVFNVNGDFKTTDDDGWNVGVNLKQKIWDFSQTSSKVEASKIDKDISKLSLKEIKALLVYKVKSLYETMVVQQKAVDVRKKDLEVKKAYYKQAQALLKEGLKTKADESRFLTSVYEAEENLEIAKIAYDKARNSLSLYMGEKIEDGVDLQLDSFNAKFLDVNVEKDILEKNYQLLMASKTIQKNILLHKASKASHYGSIDAVASYTHIDTLSDYDTKLVGVTLSIPIYSGGKLNAEVQKAKISSQIAKEQYSSTELELKEEIESLLLDIKKYNKSIEAKKAQLISAQETKDVLDGRYKEGVSTYVEVLDATSVVLNAELGLLQAQYSKSMAIHKIEYLKGKI